MEFHIQNKNNPLVHVYFILNTKTKHTLCPFCLHNTFLVYSQNKLSETRSHGFETVRQFLFIVLGLKCGQLPVTER